MEGENYITDKCIPDDDTVRVIGKMPVHTCTMMACIDSFENGVAQGRLYTFTQKSSVLFLSLDQLLLAMDDALDQVDSSYVLEKGRAVISAKKKQKENASKEKNVQCDAPLYDFQAMCPKKGKIASFSIRVYYRMNSSMQGIVLLVGKRGSVSFRSGLELMHLIYEGLSWQEKKRRKCEYKKNGGKGSTSECIRLLQRKQYK